MKTHFSAFDYDCFCAKFIFNGIVWFIKGTSTIKIKPMFSFSFVIWNFHDKKKFVKWARTLCGKMERKWTQEFLVMHAYG